MYSMNFYIALLAVITIVLYINTNSRQLLNEPLGKIVFFLMGLYMFYQSPILGIFFIIVIIVFKENIKYDDNNKNPLEILYKTKPQTPVEDLSENVIHESGLELLSKEETLRCKDSNRNSMVHNNSTSCDDDDVMCLFNNEPSAHISSKISKNIIYTNI